MSYESLLAALGIVITIIIGAFVARQIYKYKKVQKNRITVTAKNSTVSTGDIVGGDKIDKGS